MSNMDLRNHEIVLDFNIVCHMLTLEGILLLPIKSHACSVVNWSTVTSATTTALFRTHRSLEFVSFMDDRSYRPVFLCLRFFVSEGSSHFTCVYFLSLFSPLMDCHPNSFVLSALLKLSVLNHQIKLSPTFLS